MNRYGCIEASETLIPETNDPVLNSKLRILGIAKTVKLLAFLDILFSIYYAFVINPWCVVLSVLSWCGYYGSKKFKYNYILLYSISVVIYIIIKSIILLYSTVAIYIVINLLSVFTEIYLLFIVFKFYRELRELSGEILNELQEGWEPRIISFVYV